MTALAGTGAMCRLLLRRDRVRLPVWLASLLGVVYLSARAVQSAYPTQAAVDSYANSLGSSPAAIAMAGPPIALHTRSGVVIYEVTLTAVVGVSLMVIFLVNRHTRAEEEVGRTELLRSGVTGRHAGSMAALLVGALASVVLGGGIALALAGVSVPVAGAAVFGASVAALGVLFAALTLVLAQVFTHARSTLGAALVVLGVAYVLRAAGDVRDDWLVWLSPIGWSQATHPLGENRWWPLLVSLGAASLLVTLAVMLANHRDVGGGLIAPRSGSPYAAKRLATPWGLMARLQRGSLAGWVGGTFALGVMIGSLSRETEQIVRDNPTLARYLEATGQGSIVDSFFAAMLLILALVATGFAVSSGLRLLGEETSGRSELLLTAGLSRARWLVGSVSVTLVGSVLVLASAGLGMGFSHALVVADPGEVPRLVLLQLAYAPAVLLLAALTVLLVGWRPGWVGLVWLGYGFCFVAGWLGGLLGLPAWVTWLSPFSHVPSVPAEHVTVGGSAVMLLVAAALVVAGAVGHRRRDLG